MKRRTFIKQSALSCLLLNKIEFTPYQTDLVSPESVGVESASIINFINAANKSGLEWHSFIMLRHGKKIAETYWKPFEKDQKHTLYSLSKSFTSTAIGFAVQEKLLTVDTSLSSLFQDEWPQKPSTYLNAMTVKHLLTMNTGHETDTLPVMRSNENKTWTRSFLEHPVVHAPGTHFLYNTGATYMLGAIIKKLTGQNVEQYLQPRLFDIIGITEHDWENSPDGINTSGYGLRLSTDSIAKFGQFYLQKGKWNGKQILNSQWVEEATSKQTSSNPGDGDWSQGYGYQFWRCKPGFYRGDGAFGQYCIVMPDQDCVIAVNSETFDMAKSMDIMWEHLLPGIKPNKLSENSQKLAELNTLIKQQTLLLPKTTPGKENLDFLNGKTFLFAQNPFNIDSLSFSFKNDLLAMEISQNKQKQSLLAGKQNWHLNKSDIKNPFVTTARANTAKPSKIASTFVWLSEEHLQIVNKFTEAIHSDKISIAILGNQIELSFNLSSAEFGGWGPDDRKPIRSI